jgi:hypothetical protein
MRTCLRVVRSIALLLLPTVTPTIALAQTIGFDRDDFAAPVGTRGIAAADLNGDGWTDLALANTQPASVTVMLNRGAAGGFTLARTVPLGGGPFDIAAGDFDKDGRVDLAIANADGNSIEILFTESASAASWSSRPLRAATAPGGPRGLVVTDADGDGSLDIVYSAFYQDSVTVLYGNGLGGFSTRGLAAASVGVRPQGVAAADLNNDGLTDLVVANTGASLLTALYRTSSGSYIRRNIPGQQQLNVLAVTDLNGDGWADVAAVSTSRNMLAVYRGSVTGLLYSSTTATGSSPRGVASGDFNGDSRRDLVVANRGGSSASVLIQQGSAVFAVVDEIPSGSGARSVATGDFNRDGKADFATGNEFGGSMSLFRNSPGLVRAGFAFSRTRLSTEDMFFNGGLAVVDVNHNGTYDVIAGNTITLDGNTATRRTLPMPHGYEVVNLAALDYNRDGHPDLAVLLSRYDAVDSRFLHEFHLYAGDGAGNFTVVQATGGFAYARALAVADMNRDGWDDVIIVSSSPTDQHQSSLSVLLNGRNGRFSSPRQTLLTGKVYAMAIGDVTSDGKPDVALSLFDETSITVEVGDGSGGFSNEAETSISTVALDLELTDFDRDGFLDFIVTDSANVHVLRGDGQGHYSDRQIYAAGYRPGGVASAYQLLLADLTDDGLPDIVTDGGLLLPGTEAGTFGPPEEFEWHWTEARAVDLDFDGDLDLVTSGLGVEVLTNLRTAVNRIPIANAGGNRTFSYGDQFDNSEFLLDASQSSDPDLHRLTYEWRKNGQIVAYGRAWWPPMLMPGTHTYELTVRDERGGVARDTVVWTITHFEEIVIYAAASSDPEGTWQLMQDATAAWGNRVWNPDAGAAKLAAPLANPANYVDVFFTPDPTLEYKLWVRGKADRNSWANDSVFLQFTDAVDARGNQVYRIGTTSGLAVNLEECSGCGLSGWGWEDDGWGAVNAPGVMLRFPTAGGQTIRIQVREDGFSIDQIVLSAAKYKTQRPGTAKNDTTILPRTQR